MRVPAALAILLVSAPAVAAGPTTARQQAEAIDRLKAECPHTASYLADATGVFHGPPLTPKKLTQLPAGMAYMAVFRHIGGCEAPLTMVEYRRSTRR